MVVIEAIDFISYDIFVHGVQHFVTSYLIELKSTSNTWRSNTITIIWYIYDVITI